MSLRAFLATTLFLSALFVYFFLSSNKDSLTPMAILKTSFTQIHPNFTQLNSDYNLLRHNQTNDLQWRTTDVNNPTSIRKTDHSYNQTNLAISTTKSIQHHPSTDIEAVAERFRQREKRLKHFCRDKPPGKLDRTLRTRIYSAPNYNIIACITPKVQ